ncbi:MAG: EAL domain-containing protein [Pseudomonadota bacterium]
MRQLRSAMVRRVELFAGRLWLLMSIRVGQVSERAPTSLANRILMLQIVWAVIFGLLVIGSLWWGSTKVIEGSFQRQGEGWINKLDELGTPLYTSDDKEYFTETVDYLKNFPEISSVQYFNESGTTAIAEYHRDGEVAEPDFHFSEQELQQLQITTGDTKAQLFRTSDSASVFHISAPIWIKAIRSDGMFDFSLDEAADETVQVIGILRVGLDYSRYQKDLESNVMLGSGLIMLLLVMAAYIGRLLIRWSLRPLLQLEEPLNRLAQGETDVEVESSGDREIAQIGRVLNTTISALKERDETLRRMANHDSLTGLINRNYFTEKVELELQRIGREGGSSALFFLDLDRFKFINDTYGHAAGDRLLVAISNLLKQRMREGDLVARFGGDEFTALVHRVDRNQAKEIANSLLNLMQEFKFHEAGEALRIFFSIGITVFDSALQTAHEIFLQADTAVHEAKGRGRNRYHFYESSEDTIVAVRDHGWHDRINKMLEERSLLLYYQPLMGLSDNSEHICEVLLRMPDGTHEVLLPSAFFPAAERFGLMAEVDRQVIRKAVEWLASLSEKGVVLSINLSLQSFEQEEGLEQYLVELVEEFGINTQQLIFELDESVAVRNGEKIRPIIESISAIGFRFAIDNFGAGYASFDYLKHSPVNCLNIDHTLIEGLLQDPLNQITVRAIVEAAQLLGKQTVAKFVPDELTLQQLRKFGIDYAQGNFLCEALPTEHKEPPKLTLVKSLS